MRSENSDYAERWNNKNIGFLSYIQLFIILLFLNLFNAET